MNAEVKSVRLSGALQVGEGKAQPLDTATPTLRPDGRLDVLLSAEHRHVWLTLDPQSARALAGKILAALTPTSTADWTGLVPPEQASETVDLAEMDAAVRRTTGC